MANNPESAKLMESAAEAFLDHARTTPKLPHMRNAAWQAVSWETGMEIYQKHYISLCLLEC